MMEMLTGHAASHQHPFNVFLHMIGIPAIMFGMLVPLTWVGTEVGGVSVNLAHLLIAGLVLCYLTLNTWFALAFLVLALVLAYFAGVIGEKPPGVSATIAAADFFGGYAAQFVGHAVEKSMPVLVKHPVQANLAAPLFQFVEVFKVLGLRDELFDAVQRDIREQQEEGAARL